MGAREEQAAELSNRIMDEIRSVANQARTMADQEYTAFKSAVDTHAVRFNESILNEALNKPVEFVKSPEKLAILVKQRTAEYKGPTDINVTAAWADVTAKGREAQTLSRLTDTEEGRITLLEKYFNRPGYSLGQKKHDFQLMELNPPTRVPEAETLDEHFATIISSAKVLAEQTKSETQSCREKTVDRLKRAFSSFKDAIETRLIAATSTKQNEDIVWSNALSSLKLTQDLVGAVGVQPRAAIFTLDPSGYFTPGTVPTRYNVANPNEYEMSAAFSTLLDEENSFLPIPFKSQAESNKPCSFNSERFKQDRENVWLAFSRALKEEKVTIEDRHHKVVEFTLDQLRQECVDTSENPPKEVWRMRGGGGPMSDVSSGRMEWTYDPKYPDRACEALYNKESEIKSRFQVHRSFEVQ